MQKDAHQEGGLGTEQQYLEVCTAVYVPRSHQGLPSSKGSQYGDSNPHCDQICRCKTQY